MTYQDVFDKPVIKSTYDLPVIITDGCRTWGFLIRVGMRGEKENKGNDIDKQKGKSKQASKNYKAQPIRERNCKAITRKQGCENQITNIITMRKESDRLLLPTVP